MDSKNGKTFWDLIHENKGARYAAIGIATIIVAGSFFFISKGYSITKSGITPPTLKTDSFSQEKIRRLTSQDGSGDNAVHTISVIIWLTFFLQLIAILLSVISISTILRKNQNMQMTANKRMEIIEYFYKQFILLTLYDSDKSNEMLVKIQELSRYMLENGLYMSKSCSKVVNEMNDYFKEVIVDVRKKDLALELELREKFKQLIN